MPVGGFRRSCCPALVLVHICITSREKVASLCGAGPDRTAFQGRLNDAMCNVGSLLSSE